MSYLANCETEGTISYSTFVEKRKPIRHPNSELRALSMAAASPGGDADVDDYMGDLSAFLPPEDASKLLNQQQQRQKKPAKPAPRQRPDDWKKLTWQERRKQVREEKDKAEAADLAEGLAAPIPPSNIGFKLLQKMGFKGPPATQGMGGKAEFPSAGRMGSAEIGEGGERPVELTGEATTEDNGGGSVPATAPNRKKPLVWVEPVALSLKRDRKGLGKEEEEEQAERQKQLGAEAAARVRQRGEEALRGGFEERRKGRWSEWKVRGALRKARTALLHLEGGEEWLKAQAVRIGAASSSSQAASGFLMGAGGGGSGRGGAGAGGARSGGARSGGARCGGARCGGARCGGARCGGAGGTERGAVGA
ncbi:unnamed protein product [Closterium sp. Yama58-4]|nr:unnamed protein product [Closterium sp. Yama58-4]